MRILDEMSLAESVTWSTRRTSIKQPLRSRSLDPREEFPIVLEREWGDDFVSNQLELERCQRESVDRVVKKRREALGGKFRANWRDMARTGRVLFFDPSWAMRDGLAGGETTFFDVEVPAWDTWVQYVANLTEWQMRASEKWDKPVDSLVCWVPASWIQEVSRGIYVNAEHCLCWADDESIAHLPLVTELKTIGLV